MENPIVLWAHDYGSLPIGVTDSIQKDQGRTIAKGRFAPTDFAQQVRKLYDLKIVRATSVGFIPKEMEGNIVTKSELLEFSFVPVPANPYALSLMKSAELNVAELVTKGIMLKAEENPENQSERENTAPEGEDVAKTEPAQPGSNLEAETADKSAETAKEDKGDQSIKEKAGRVLSEKNRKLIQSTVSNLQTVTAALEELLSATESQGSGGEESSDGSSPKQRSNDAGSSAKQEFNNFLFMHEVLRTVNIATSNALETFNSKVRK
jgi:hypothetical protein